MIDALLTHNFVDRLHDIPWHVVPVSFAAIAAVVLAFIGLYKLLNRFFGETIEIYEEEEKDNDGV